MARADVAPPRAAWRKKAAPEGSARLQQRGTRPFKSTQDTGRPRLPVPPVTQAALAPCSPWHLPRRPRPLFSTSTSRLLGHLSSHCTSSGGLGSLLDGTRSSGLGRLVRLLRRLRHRLHLLPGVPLGTWATRSRSTSRLLGPLSTISTCSGGLGHRLRLLRLLEANSLDRGACKQPEVGRERVRACVRV